MVDSDTALKIAKGTIDLTKTEWRVWNILLHHVRAGNYVYHTRSFMAGEMDLETTNFHAAIRGLITKDMVVPAPDSGLGKSLMLNPLHTWHGGKSEHSMAVRQYIGHAKRNAKKV